ncbi:MAG: hypothetical protein ACRD4I_06850, partial [Candidatus Angelobacter sp.]
MKSARLLYVVALFTMAFLLACGSKSSTTATSTESAAAGAPANASVETVSEKSASEAVVIPAGRVIAVRFGETLSSNRSSAG